MHASVILLVFGECEAETVTRREVSNYFREARSVVPGAVDAQGFAAGLLREVLGAPIEAHAQPAGDWFANRHKELEQRAQVCRQRTEDRVRANQNLFRRGAILIKD